MWLLVVFKVVLRKLLRCCLALSMVFQEVAKELQVVVRKFESHVLARALLGGC